MKLHVVSNSDRQPAVGHAHGLWYSPLLYRNMVSTFSSRDYKDGIILAADDLENKGRLVREGFQLRAQRSAGTYVSRGELLLAKFQLNTALCYLLPF